MDEQLSPAPSAPGAAPVRHDATEAVRAEVERTTAAAAVRLRIHDASRVEWDVTLPLPRDRPLSYEIVAEIDVPAAAAAVRESPWDQLQARTRLDGSAAIPSPDGATVDALRRGAVTLGRMLRRAQEGFARQCRSAVSAVPAADAQGAAFPALWLEAALRSVRGAREELSRAGPHDAPLLTRERRLADEFASVRLLDMLAEAEGAVRTCRPLATTPDARKALDALDARLGRAMRDEMAYRAMHELPGTDPSPEALERYVARAARLKRHFEEVLFLDRETEQLDERVQLWSRVVAAMLGGIFAMAPLQLLLSRRAAPRGVGWGLLALALVTGLTYALREHITGRGSAWLRRKMGRFHTQRVLRCRVPARGARPRDVLIEAREWCRQLTRSRPDPLNPEGGASLPVTKVQYRHQGVLRPHAELSQTGVRRVLHIFRYDLSPIFPRLDGAAKQVPVAGDDGRVTFVAAPRRYQAPISVILRIGGERHEERATLVLERGGLRRLAPWEGPAER